jgi:succinyl-diaminopimelate desuccinylase
MTSPETDWVKNGIIDGRDPISLAQKLVQCPSVTPLEAGAISLLENLLKRAGFQTHHLVFSSPQTSDVHNLYARIGTKGPVFLFAGHTDVVPPGSESLWQHPPFSGQIADHILHGRGACDMKSGVACMISATLNWIEKQNLENTASWGSIAFLITGDEEAEAINGTQRVLSWAQEKGEHFDACIVGEPSSVNTVGDRIKIGRRGSLSGNITIHGQQGHTAYPENAKNPIPVMTQIVTSLLNAPFDSGSVHFEPSHLEFTSIDVGNLATNVIPATAKASFNVRFNDCWTEDTLKKELLKRVSACASSLPYTIDFLPHASQVFIPLEKNKPFIEHVIQVIAKETGEKPEISTNGGTSDARFIKDYCPVIELGLCGSTMHKVNECVPLKELATLTSLYENILDSFFKIHSDS